MTLIDNGGAHAIKGFNYQKSVVVLISVLHYLSEENFEMYIESKDDIVVMLDNINTYIQIKSSHMGIAALTKRKDGKDSVLEKNHANGSEGTSFYKVVSPSFTNSSKYLDEAKPLVFKGGADVFEYTSDAINEINRKLPKMSESKLQNSRLVLTKFKANMEDAMTYLKGVMVEQGIPVDNNHGMASLQELCLRIDQQSEKVIKDELDLKKKKLTSQDLSMIFSNTYKVKCFEDVLDKLNYSTAKKEALKNRRVAVAAIYKSFYDDAMREIEKLDILEMEESEVLEQVLATVDFDGIPDKITRVAVVIDAYSQLVFDRRVK